MATINDINNTLINQLETQLNQTIPALPRSFLRVLARALAGLYITLYKYTGFIGLQQFVSRASYQATEINGVEVIPLIEWGRLLNVPDPAPGVQAELTASAEVTAQGGTLPGGTQYTNPATGVIYVTVAPVALTGSAVSLTLRAVGDQSNGGGVGSIGNMENGQVLNLISPVSGIRREATVISTTTPGSDPETEDSYRQRVVDRFQRTPQGGAYADYAQWASEPPTTARAYTYTSTIPGIVDVYIESSTQPDGIPTGAELAAALDAINQPDRRPANAIARTLPITRSAFDVDIVGLNTPNPGVVQLQIAAALDEYFLSREPFIEGLSVPPRLDRVTRAAVTAAISDVVTADGGFFSEALVERNGAPVVVYTLNDGEKAKLGNVGYI